VELVAENRVAAAAPTGANDDGGGTMVAGGRGETGGRRARLDQLGAPRTVRQRATGDGGVLAEHERRVVDTEAVVGAIGSWWARARIEHAHDDHGQAGPGGPT
jgi:hypothetical protein